MIPGGLCQRVGVVLILCCGTLIDRGRKIYENPLPISAAPVPKGSKRIGNG